jgi:histidinol-phosphatase
MSGETYSNLLEFAVDVAQQAGRHALSHFRTGIATETKADDSPVTSADRGAERIARDLIEARFPEDGIVGEEFGTVREGARRRWILDPIDGTRSFIHGVPFFGALLALEEAGDVIVGVIDFPALQETVWAAVGEGCWCNGARARVSSVAQLDKALVLCTSYEAMDLHGREAEWRRVSRAAGVARTWGDCYGHALVATGRAEAMFDSKMAVWDSAALKPVIEEAGGVFTDWEGNPTHLGDSAISTNAALDREIRSLLGSRE